MAASIGDLGGNVVEKAEKHQPAIQFAPEAPTGVSWHASSFPLDARPAKSVEWVDMPARMKHYARPGQWADPVSARTLVVPTRNGYDRWAEFYDGEDNPLVLLEGRHIRPLLGRVAGLRIADIGCGTGRHALRWAAAGAKVTAVDFSEGMLRCAQSKPGSEKIRFLKHNLARRLPLPTAGFDLVCCCLVLDHIRGLENFFAELRRLCRPRGRVVISVMHPAMSLRGVQARFIEPKTGQRISPGGHAHSIADYLTAAKKAKLQLDQISEHCCDAALLRKSPRAEKYRDWPMLLLMGLVPAAKTGGRCGPPGTS